MQSTIRHVTRKVQVNIYSHSSSIASKLYNKQAEEKKNQHAMEICGGNDRDERVSVDPI